MHLAVLLAGDHPTLPRAELEAVVAVAAPGARVHTEGLVAVVHADTPALRKAMDRLAQAMAWGEWWGTASDDEAGLEALAAVVRAHAPGQGAAAVAFERRGLAKSPNHEAVVRRLGDALREAGHTIDLRGAQHRVFAWFADGRVTVGLLQGTMAHGSFRHRHVDNRDHFHPVSLHPRRAASLLHLARVPPGGRVYDPFCGTGGIVLEAALEGHEAWGSDLDAWMVQGTHQTLADIPPEPLEASVFVADVEEGCHLVPPVDAIITDMPYGKASTTAGEQVRALHARSLRAFRACLRPGGRAVIGTADATVAEEAVKAGWTVLERHEEHVHRSLVRHWMVLARPAPEAPAAPAGMPHP
ncbi:MAG TPA: hypothetical protein VFH47_02165 [Candidatus Thermoplasmatota archaeon]|nr:hypothetical protein [Candidatus Thermoplasmatota archaeon]